MSREARSSLVEAWQQAGVSEVECVTPDLNGVPRGKVMTLEGFASGRNLQMARGVLLQSLVGHYPDAQYYGSDDGDLVLEPVLSQSYQLPWAEQPRALTVCDCVEIEGQPSGLSSRTLLKRIVERYAAKGWSPVVATELEFFIFAPHADPYLPFQPPVGLDGRREEGYSAFSVASNNGLRPFWAEVYRCMEAMGMPRDTFMHEMGVSQFEINFHHGDALKIADQTFLFKHMVKEVALKHGLIAVFMAKPLAKVAGSSMHLHQSVVDGAGKNIFNDAAGEATPEFFHYLGGLQDALADLTLLLAPNINSYQRLFHPYASPNNFCWAHDNRASGLRIPPSVPEARRVENRVAGCDANPYLLLAVSLAAGLRGIEQKLEPTEPIAGDFTAPENMRLPTSMQEAMRRLKRSSLARELLGEEFIEGFLASKYIELEDFLSEITAWERRFLAMQV